DAGGMLFSGAAASDSTGLPLTELIDTPFPSCFPDYSNPLFTVEARRTRSKTRRTQQDYSQAVPELETQRLPKFSQRLPPRSPRLRGESESASFRASPWLQSACRRTD